MLDAAFHGRNYYLPFESVKLRFRMYILFIYASAQHRLTISIRMSFKFFVFFKPFLGSCNGQKMYGFRKMETDTLHLV